MRPLILISVVLLLTSCVPHSIRQIKKGGTRTESMVEFSTLPTLAQKSLLYRTKIDYKDNHYSGILVMKEVSEDEYRIVLMTEVGMKLFDFGLSKESFTVYDCFPALNRKIMLDILEGDFRMLLKIGNPERHIKQLQNHESSMLVSRFKINQLSPWYVLGTETKEVSKISRTAVLPIGVEIDLMDYENGIPAKINIWHKKIKLAFSLTYMPK